MGFPAKPFLHESWRNIVGTQKQRCTIAFDLDNFVFSHALKRPIFSQSGRIFCFAKKNTPTVRTSQNCRHVKTGKTLLLFKITVVCKTEYFLVTRITSTLVCRGHCICDEIAHRRSLFCVPIVVAELQSILQDYGM